MCFVEWMSFQSKHQLILIHWLSPMNLSSPLLSPTRLQPTSSQTQGKIRSYFGGMMNDESFTKAAGERSLGLRDANFRSGDFSRVTSDEVILGLGRSQLADRWQHTESITSQQDDVLRVTTHARDTSVGNVFNGVRGTSVFSDSQVVEINFVRDTIHYNIFQYRAKANGIKDLRLLLMAQFINLSIIRPPITKTKKKSGGRIDWVDQFWLTGTRYEQKK